MVGLYLMYTPHSDKQKLGLPLPIFPTSDILNLENLKRGLPTSLCIGAKPYRSNRSESWPYAMDNNGFNVGMCATLMKHLTLDGSFFDVRIRY